MKYSGLKTLSLFAKLCVKITRQSKENKLFRLIFLVLSEIVTKAHN